MDNLQETNTSDPGCAPSVVPPEDAQLVTEDGGVRKCIIRDGSGNPPPLHASCLVHYIGRVAETGDEFMNTKKESTLGEPMKVVAGRDSALTEKGLYLVVGTMRRGERCHVWVAPQYGYGKKGNFSFPTVPPEAHLTYDIELVDFEPPVEGKEQRDMTYEERLEAADRRRLEGNDAFRVGNYEESMQKYNAALSFINEDLLLQLQDFHYDRAMAARLPCLLNLAACHLKMNQYYEAISAASQVLSHDANNSKALYRRAVARHELGQTEEAMSDLLLAKEKSPSDSGIIREIAAVRQTIRKEKEAQGKIFGGFVDKIDRSGGLYEESECSAASEDTTARDPHVVNGRQESLQQDSRFAMDPESWYGRILQMICPWIFTRRQKSKEF